MALPLHYNGLTRLPDLAYLRIRVSLLLAVVIVVVGVEFMNSPLLSPSSPFSYIRRNSLKSLGNIAIVTTSLAISLASCRLASNDAETADTFIENGRMWAYGEVELTSIQGTGVVMVGRDAAVNSVVTTQAANASKYEIFGATLGANSTQGHFDLAYVDYHPTADKLLAYSYTLSVQERSGVTDVVDIYAKLNKGGRTWPYILQMYLGTATFTDATATTAKMKMDSRLQLSLIATGVYRGSWAVHYATPKLLPASNFGAFCEVNTPNLTANQSLCRSLPANLDLCSGNPSSSDCQPAIPTGLETDSDRSVAPFDVKGFDILGPSEDRVYTTSDDYDTIGKITFVSKFIPATADENTIKCSESFFAVSRTVGELANPLCQLTLAPAEPVNGFLTCAVQVHFANATSYIERVCNIKAFFVAPDTASAGTNTEEAPQVLQIIKK